MGRPSTLAIAILAGMSLLAACSSDSDATDAAVPGDARRADAGMDAAGPDAAGLCAGGLELTGGYVDWDSTDQAFDGIEFATLTEVGDPQNTATTAPNGRGTLCVPAAGRSLVDFAQADYLDLRYTVDPEAAAAGPFEIPGLTPARADELFTGELGVTRDPAAAQVLVAVRTYPGGEPAAGAQVSLGSAHQGAFTSDGAGAYVAGDTLTDDAFVLFANVDPGQTAVTVIPPEGMTCAGPDTLDAVAGGLAATTFACSP